MKVLKPLIKILISILILFFVFKKIDLPALWETIQTARPLYLLLAFGLFLFSQYVSSLRLGYFWKDVDIKITKQYNWKLYLLGMYYNLLLPGGIGGDGYKVYILDKKHNVGKGKLVKALIFDRLSGLLGLGLWLCALLSGYFYSSEQPNLYAIFSVLLAFIALMLSYLIICNFFTIHRPSYFPSLGLSLIIQGLQLGTCLAILVSFSVNQYILAYLVLFLISSIAATIPITFGGAGARELTFLTGAAYFPIAVNIAISLSVIFYIITVLASLIGLFYSFKQKIE